MFSPQSSSCKVNISPVRFHAAPKPKLVLIGFSQRTWKIIPAKSKTQKGWIHRHVQALHEYFTARRLTWSWWSSTLFLTLMEDAEQTQTWNRKIGLTHSLRGPTRNDYLHSVQCKATAMVSQAIQPFCERDTTGSPTVNQSWRVVHGQEDWVWEARDKFVSSHFCIRNVIDIANDRLDRTRWWTKNGVVQVKSSPRPRLYLFLQSTTCSKRKCGSSSK